ncbi:unnamed protein product [Adineta ricciae]|uniref:Uncharacterized protein n=1 Tax=Adineta ricciae TaxID=249248 RepID=A0A814FG32_ADIRI|nr:unnamed protein product [Adineta ricciae]
MNSQLSDLRDAFYDSKRREVMGRDGYRWAKLAIFYSSFSLGLTGFFCAMIAVLMFITPQDIPRYSSADSCMETRSSPISPGMGFRPQPNVLENLIYVNQTTDNYDSDPYIKNLNQYLQVYYGKPKKSSAAFRPFIIQSPHDCTPEKHYGFSTGRPCVLVKMNKIVDFMPKPGCQEDDQAAYEKLGCQPGPDAIAVHCYGESASDIDSIGDMTYISENTLHNQCGSLATKWFPYKGKVNRQDLYQAPYVWIQFNNLQPNVLVHVICRLYAQNIYFDKKSLGFTRFKLFLKNSSSRQNHAP